MFQQHHHFLHVLNQTLIIKNLRMNHAFIVIRKCAYKQIKEFFLDTFLEIERNYA